MHEIFWFGPIDHVGRQARIPRLHSTSVDTVATFRALLPTSTPRPCTLLTETPVADTQIFFTSPALENNVANQQSPGEHQELIEEEFT
jgi:hypothetical protein